MGFLMYLIELLFTVQPVEESVTIAIVVQGLRIKIRDQ
jgi:hypothetical protein